MDGTPRSRLKDELTQRETFAASIFPSLAASYANAKQAHPQLYAAWRKLSGEDQFNAFVAAFRGGIANAKMLALLQDAISAGKFGPDDLDHIIAGRKKIVDVPPEFWPADAE